MLERMLQECQLRVQKKYLKLADEFCFWKKLKNILMKISQCYSSKWIKKKRRKVYV